jgi:hypothetical protein
VLLPRWPRSDGDRGFRDHDGYDGVFLEVPGTGSDCRSLLLSSLAIAGPASPSL